MSVHAHILWCLQYVYCHFPEPLIWKKNCNGDFCTSLICICIVHTYIHKYDLWVHAFLCINVCLSMCMCIYVYKYIFVSVWFCEWVYIYIYMSAFVTVSIWYNVHKYAKVCNVSTCLYKCICYFTIHIIAECTNKEKSCYIKTYDCILHVYKDDPTYINHIRSLMIMQCFIYLSHKSLRVSLILTFSEVQACVKYTFL